MRYPDAKRQLDTAVSNVESALSNLADRLEDALPRRRHRRSAIRNTGRAIRRTTNSVVERSPEYAASLVAETRRTAREHPVRVALAVAFAGYCLWSVLRFTSRQSAEREDKDFIPGDRDRQLRDSQVVRH